LTSEVASPAARRAEVPPPSPEAPIRIGGARVAIAPHNCFACGSLNTHGLQLELHAAEGRCWTELTLPKRFEGWDGIAHGGIVCTILDEVMAWALIETDAWGVTARLNVEFRRPVPIGTPIRAEGTAVEERRRVLRASGRIVERDTGALLAVASGTYVAAPPERKAELKRRYQFRIEPAEPPDTGDRS
jgi:uncharacterized protein (TIGR00369 family)